MTLREQKALEYTAPLLRQMCELSLEIFDHLEPAIENEMALRRLRTLAATMRRVIAMSKGEHDDVQDQSRH